MFTMRLAHLLWLSILLLNIDGSLQQTRVKCTVPEIEHGSVPGNRQEYDEDDILDYQCDPRYGRIDFRPSTCARLGRRADWSPTPVCERILCERDLQDPLVTNFHPPQLIQIRVSDTATYSCIRGYKKKVSKTTCTGQGWTPDPLCEEITCDPNRLPNADVEHLKPVYKDREWVNVVCKPGYKGGYAATCTENGWRRRGRGQGCTDVTCNREDYINAEIEGVKRWQYKYNERVDYICKNGFTGRFTLTCGQDGWIKDRDCAATLEESDCGALPVIPNMEVSSQQTNHRNGSSVPIRCKEGYSSEVQHLRCNEGEWHPNNTLLCTQSGCGRPPPLEDGDIIMIAKDDYRYNERVEYSCFNLYTMEGGPFKTCKNGEWTGEIRCIKPCTVDEDLMAARYIQFRYSYEKKLYLTHNEAVEFLCLRGRTHDGIFNMRQKCNDGVIDLPTCV